MRLAAHSHTDAKPAAVLLEKLLQLDPEKRCSATEAMKTQYLAPYHDPDDEPTAAEKCDWSFLEADLSADVWKTIMYSEVLSFHEKSDDSTGTTPQISAMDLG